MVNFSVLRTSLIRLWTRLVPQSIPPAMLGAVIRAAGLGTQLLVLILMGRLLPKSTFGDAILVFTIYRLISYGIGSGLGSLIIYHVARRIDDVPLDVRLTRTVTLAATVVAGAATLMCILFSQPIAALFDKPDMAPWLVHMAPMVLFGALLQVTASSLDARALVSRSIVLTELTPNLLRLAGMAAVVWMGLPQTAIAWVFWIAAAVPWLLDSLRLLSPLVKGMEGLTLSDMRYAFWLAVYPLLGMQLQGIDMLIVGALFSSALVADYSIASRLATLFPFLQQMVVRVFTPHSGLLFQRNDIEKINLELKQLRRLSLVSTCVMSAAILLGAPVIVQLMGDYGDSLVVLVALAIPPLVRSNFAGIEVVLRMRGHGASMALIAAATAATIVIGSLSLHSLVGLYALSISMTASAIFINAFAASRIRRAGIYITDWRSVPLIAGTCTILALAALFFTPVPAALLSGAVLAIVGGAVFVWNKMKRSDSVARAG